MALKELLQPRGKNKDIMVRKAPGALHEKIERRLARERFDGRELTKPQLIVELLLSHPKLKSL